MRFLIPLALVASFCTSAAPVLAEPHETTPNGCVSMETTRQVAHQVASLQGGSAADLEGQTAQKFLYFVNAAIGQPTFFKAERVGLLAFPTRNMAVVLMASGPCGYNVNALRISYSDALKAMAFAMGEQM